MRMKIEKRMIALVLSICLVVGCIYISPWVMANADNTSKTTLTYDFNSAEQLNDWSKMKFQESKEVNFDMAIKGLEGGNGYLELDGTQGLAVTDKLPTNAVIHSVSFDVVSLGTVKLGYFAYFTLVGYSSENSYSLYDCKSLDVNMENWQFRPDCVVDGMSVPGKGAGNTNVTGSDLSKGYHVDIQYNQKGKTAAVTVTTLDSGRQLFKHASLKHNLDQFTYALPSCYLRGGTIKNQIGYDNLSITYEEGPAPFEGWTNVNKDTGVASKNALISYTKPEEEAAKYVERADIQVASGNGMRVIYAYEDERNYHYLGYEIGESNEIKAVLRQVENGREKAENANAFIAIPTLGTDSLKKFSDGIGTNSDYTIRLSYPMNKTVNITFINNKDTTKSVTVNIVTSKTSVKYFSPSNMVRLYTSSDVTLGGFAFTYAKAVPYYTVEEFIDEFGAVLALSTSSVAIGDKGNVEAALAVYAGLCSEEVQKELTTEKKILDALKAKIVELENQQILGATKPTIDATTTYILKDDFENSNAVLGWGKAAMETMAGNNQMANGGIAVELERVTDAKDKENHVLQMTGAYGLAVPYSFRVPNKGALKSASYDVVSFNKSGWGLRIVGAYLDENNYSYLDFNYEDSNGDKVADRWVYRPTCVVNGTALNQGGGGGKGSLENADFDLADGFHVDMAFDSKNFKIFITLSSLEDPEVKSSVSVQYGSQQWGFALQANTNIWSSIAQNVICYDNVSVEYMLGDWDENVEIETPIVYYTGNTTVRPGETAMISGEELGRLVGKVELVELPKDTDAFGYILQDTYGAPATEAKYTKATDAKAAYEAALLAANMTAGKEVEIVQTTTSAVKFIMPEEFSTGVYAVKLTTKSGSEATYVYLNRPEISYTVGDEGKIATAGGSVRVIGYHLALLSDGEDVTTDTENMLGVDAVLKGADGTLHNCTVSAVQTDYSMTVQIPGNLAFGTYELSVYNGFGGNSAWAQPIEITVGASPRDSWPKDVFDVTDYGADPEEDTIDTAGIINALEAAAENGGGIVRVPAGIYCITYTIAIPSNVHLMGDGMEKSYIIFSSAHYDFNQMPDAIIALQGECEVSGISILATRAPSVIRAGYDAQGGVMENIYIDDVRIETHPEKGTIANGGGGQFLISSLTDFNALLQKENTNKFAFDFVGKEVHTINERFYQNLQITNSVSESYTTFRFNVSNLYVANNDIGSYQGFGGTHPVISGEKIIYENNTRSGRRSGGNFDGDGAYYDGNEFGDMNSNNAEIITTDGGLDYGYGLSGIIQKVTETQVWDKTGKQKIDTNDCYYRFADGTNYKDDNWTGRMLNVQMGQGAFQSRIIVDSWDDILVLSDPFVVEPNRNSRVSIELARDSWIYTNNVTRSGAYIGTYGTQINTVYDNNDFTFSQGHYLYAHVGAPVWYQSMINCTVEDPIEWHVHDEGNNEHTGYGGLILKGYGAGEVINFVLMRGNTLRDDARIQLFSPNANNVKNVIIENNSIEDATYGIIYAANTNAMDGIFIKDMTYTNVKYPIAGAKGGSDEYSSSYDAFVDQKNEYRDLKFYVYMDVTDENMGDVNMDGKVDEMDVKLIRLYLVGRLELTDEMWIRADVNKDGLVNMKDAWQCLTN